MGPCAHISSASQCSGLVEERERRPHRTGHMEERLQPSPPHSGLGWLPPFEFAKSATSKQAKALDATIFDVYVTKAIASPASGDPTFGSGATIARANLKLDRSLGQGQCLHRVKSRNGLHFLNIPLSNEERKSKPNSRLHRYTCGTQSEHIQNVQVLYLIDSARRPPC
jgi:hypothetical protein